MFRALLVGIDNYPLIKVNGCVNSIEDIESFLLTNCNFKTDDIVTLKDEQATKQNILENLDLLITNISSGDHVLFYYCGHGAQFPISDSNNNVIEMHEVICPIEFAWTIQSSISDTELNRIMSQVPTGINFLWVSDSCNSGGLANLEAKPNVKATSFIPNSDIGIKIAQAHNSGIQLQKFSDSIQDLNLAFLSACNPNQRANTYKYEDRYQCVFTTSLIHALCSPQGLTQSLKDVVDEVRINITQEGWDQEPLLEGSSVFRNTPFLNIEQSYA